MNHEIATPFQQVLTTGNFEKETESVARLNLLLSKMNLFNIVGVVWGEYEYVPHYKDSGKRPRIDMLLTPTARLMDAGWPYGAMGIECKRSNCKIGPPLSQILDYGRAIFRHPKFNVLIKPDFIFLWPCDKIHGDIASLMAQNRFGSMCEHHPETPYHSVRFYCGEQKVLRYTFQDENPIDINTKLIFGKRVGSR